MRCVRAFADSCGPPPEHVALSTRNGGQELCIATIRILARVQVTPIFASAEFRDGGLRLKPSELALPMAAGGIMLTLFALIIYPRVQPRLGMLWTCRLGLLMLIPTALLIPAASLFVSNGPWQPGGSSSWLWRSLWRNLFWRRPRQWRWHHHWQHSQYHQSTWQYIESQVCAPACHYTTCAITRVLVITHAVGSAFRSVRECAVTPRVSPCRWLCAAVCKIPAIKLYFPLLCRR